MYIKIQIQEKCYSVLKLISSSTQTVILHGPVKCYRQNTGLIHLTSALHSSVSALAPCAHSVLSPVVPLDPRWMDRGPANVLTHSPAVGMEVTVFYCSRFCLCLQRCIDNSPLQRNITVLLQHATPHVHIDLVLERVRVTHSHHTNS